MSLEDAHTPVRQRRWHGKGTIFIGQRFFGSAAAQDHQGVIVGDAVELRAQARMLFEAVNCFES